MMRVHLDVTNDANPFIQALNHDTSSYLALASNRGNSHSSTKTSVTTPLKNKLQKSAPLQFKRRSASP
jgi:hypothetical protein